MAIEITDYPSSSDYEHIYRLLDHVTPLDYDCGILCGKACCNPAYPGTGIYLLPNEDSMFSRHEDWLEWEEHQAAQYDFPPSWTGRVLFVRCTRPCHREQRPIQCRTFPLAPHLLHGQKLVLIKEVLSLPYQCPILKQDIPLSPNFAPALYEAWSLLNQTRLIHDLLVYDSRKRERNRWLRLEQVYP
ncbi:MAG: hypothetical protein H5U02_07850 [Clostridia bacterium]|nr:hypothetical protein [Clostridia bacterium]